MAAIEVEPKFRKAHLDQFITFKIILALEEEGRVLICFIFRNLGVYQKSQFMYLLIPGQNVLLL